jgi:hypothetical protein
VRSALRIFPHVFRLFSGYFPRITCFFSLPVCNFSTHQAMTARRAVRFPAYSPLIFQLFPAYFPLIFLS